MDVNYSGDVSQLDERVREAAAERPGQPVRLRVQPSMRRGDGRYTSWQGVVWRIDCPTAEDAIALKEAMRAFFTAAQTIGSARVSELLQRAIDG